MDSATKIKCVTVTKDFSQMIVHNMTTLLVPQRLAWMVMTVCSALGKGSASLENVYVKLHGQALRATSLRNAREGTMERHAVVMGNVFTQGP